MKKIITFRYLITLVCFIGIGGMSVAQNKTTIPLNESVKYGKLGNGMTYYVLHNEEPKDRASFYFVQNVGAILEEDSQNGLAHFLEHMAFNGLKNFPGKSMISYLESSGIKFGRDINAYTAQDETVYNISNIPVANEHLIDSALLALHDWSGGLLLEAAEIEAERGVIHEEWRTRRNVRKRLNDQSTPVVYNHSKYADRDIIGSLDVIDHFKHQELRDYYNKWYRPDLQAVIVVGDFDANTMEQKVKTLFSQIPEKENAAERVYYPVEDSNKTGYVMAKDKEARVVSINWIFRKPVVTLRDEAFVRNNYVHGMFNTMFNSRLSEILRQPECAAVSMQIGNFEMARTKAANYIGVVPKENRELEAFEQFMTEFERVRRYGFTQSELDRTKVQFLRNVESYYENREKISNESWANKLQRHFLKAVPTPSVEQDVKLSNQIIPSITLEEVNVIVEEFMTLNNSVFSLSGPDKEDIHYPTMEELFGIIKNVESVDVAAYEDEADNAPLVTDELIDVQVVEGSVVEGIEAQSYVLANGARVVLLPTDYSKDQILFNAYSFGGKSLLNRDELESADVAAALAQISGVGSFNAIQLRKKLTGKIASVKPQLSEFTEGFEGSSSAKDLETLLQLIYMRFEHPRFDEQALKATMGMWRNNLVNAKADNNKALQDTIGQLNANHHERALMFSEAFLDNVSFDKAKNIYLNRFQNADEFTFLFVGNLDVKKDLPLIAKYIGNIKANKRQENWVDHEMRMAEGASQRVFEREMQVPKTTVYYGVNNEVEYSLKTRMYVRVVAELLSKRYMETIREEEGGSYGVAVRPMISKLPYEHAQITVNFDCAPEKQERLREIVNEEIEKIASKTCNEVDLDEIKKNYVKSRAEAEKQNSFWLSVIKGSLMNNEAIASTKEYNDLVNGIDAKSVLKFAKKFFKNPDSVEVVMNPKESK
ncbi:insulinase family protein [Puteibacter caeruleilacunae]|nr:insulinase family protein [Puteibacter caeruleilacunae]